MFDDARAASRQARSLRSVGHRPFPLPDEPLDARADVGARASGRTGPVPAEDVRARVPDELEIEEHDGTRLARDRRSSACARCAPAARCRCPGISSFLQLNVRTYVRGPDGLPGVWFFSIDASSRLAALGVRRIYHVPAFHARMTLDPVGGLAARSSACGSESPAASSRRATAPPARRFHAEPGSLEWFLTERYRLFAARRARPRCTTTAGCCSPAEAEVELDLDRAVRARRRAALPLLLPAGRAHLAA